MCLLLCSESLVSLAGDGGMGLILVIKLGLEVITSSFQIALGGVVGPLLSVKLSIDPSPASSLARRLRAAEHRRAPVWSC